MIILDSSKQQAVDADPNALQQINFTGNLDKLKKQQCFLELNKQKK